MEMDIDTNTQARGNQYETGTYLRSGARLLNAITVLESLKECAVITVLTINTVMGKVLQMICRK